VASEVHALALKNGAAIAWGEYAGTLNHAPAAAQHDVVVVSAGGYHDLVLKADGSVVEWGLGDLGSPAPPDVRSGVSAISAGHTTWP
jgi:alpha-tubulin suppressor-like RCC1 family protein